MLTRHRIARARLRRRRLPRALPRRSGRRDRIEYALIAAILGTALIASIAPLTSAFVATRTRIAEAV